VFISVSFFIHHFHQISLIGSQRSAKEEFDSLLSLTISGCKSNYYLRKYRGRYVCVPRKSVYAIIAAAFLLSFLLLIYWPGSTTVNVSSKNEVRLGFYEFKQFGHATHSHMAYYRDCQYK
jgi:hypothetical protein